MRGRQGGAAACGLPAGDVRAVQRGGLPVRRLLLHAGVRALPAQPAWGPSGGRPAGCTLPEVSMRGVTGSGNLHPVTEVMAAGHA